MSPRDTSTGAVLEAMVIPALMRGGYEFETQKEIGIRPNGRKHVIDVVARKGGRTILVSVKWQQVSGTAEQKVPFEVICLADTVRKSHGAYDVAYLVLGGDGWTLRDYFVSGQMEEYMHNIESVLIVKLETFIAKANRGQL